MRHWIFKFLSVILNTFLNNLIYFFILISCLFTCVGFNYSVHVCVRTGVSIFDCMWSLETHLTISIRHPAAKSLAWQQIKQWQPPVAEMWFEKHFSWGGSFRHAWIICWGRNGGVVFVKWYTGRIATEQRLTWGATGRLGIKDDSPAVRQHPVPPLPSWVLSFYLWVVQPPLFCHVAGKTLEALACLAASRTCFLCLQNPLVHSLGVLQQGFAGLNHLEGDGHCSHLAFSSLSTSASIFHNKAGNSPASGSPGCFESRMGSEKQAVIMGMSVGVVANPASAKRKLEGWRHEQLECFIKRHCLFFIISEGSSV